MHLIDIENLARGEFDRFEEAMVDYRRVVFVGRDDQLVVGCDRTNAIAAARAVPGCRLVVGRNADGGERAILAASDPADLGARFDRVVIGSGDHLFTALAAAVAGTGAWSVVVSHRDGLARSLALVAHVVTFMPGRGVAELAA
jgi:hypothetical protein